MSTIVVLLISLLARYTEVSGIYNSTGRKNLPAGCCVLSRWKLFTSFHDTNKDGTISVDDAEQASKRFTRHLGLINDERKRLTEEKLNTSIISCFMRSGQEVPENEYGVLQRDAYFEDKTKFVEKVQECLNQLIDILDANNDYYISEDELKAIEVALDFKDEKREKAFYESLGPDAKGIPLHKQIEDLLSYYGDDDCSNDELQLGPLKTQLSN